MMKLFIRNYRKARDVAADYLLYKTIVLYRIEKLSACIYNSLSRHQQEN